MRKTVIISLFFALLIPNILGLIWLKYERITVKKEAKRVIKNGLSKQELTFFSFSKSEIQSKINWKDSEEFELNHKMYDVVKMEKLGNKINFWCLLDEKENQINTKFEFLVNNLINEHQQKSSNHQKVMDFLKVKYLSNDYNILINNIFTTISNQYIYVFSVKTNEQNPSSPPPNFV